MYIFVYMSEVCSIIEDMMRKSVIIISASIHGPYPLFEPGERTIACSAVLIKILFLVVSPNVSVKVKCNDEAKTKIWCKSLSLYVASLIHHSLASLASQTSFLAFFLIVDSAVSAAASTSPSFLWAHVFEYFSSSELG